MNNYNVTKKLTKEQYDAYSDPKFSYFGHLFSGLGDEPFFVFLVAIVMYLVLSPYIILVYTTLTWKVYRFKKKYPEEFI